MTIYTRLAVLAALSVLPISATAEDEAQPSADDCAVISAVTQGMSPSGPMGPKSFGKNCNWKELGLPQIQVSTEEHPVFSFGYTKPVYSADGLHVTVELGIGGDNSARGHPEQYFYSGSKCTLEKRAGKWTFLSCKMSYIT